MKIILITQVYENYGAHDWDGKGECPQYWKAKGGDEYELDRTLTVNEAADSALVKSLVDAATAKLNKRNNSFEEYVIDWELVMDDYLTPFERSQMEWEGKVTYPRTKLSLAA